MDTNRNLRTKGIVLSSHVYKESSKLIELLSSDYGKIKVFAQGALNPKKELLEVTSLLAESDFLISKVKDNYYLKEASLVNSNYELSKDVSAFLVAKYIGELLSKTLMPENTDKSIFDLTKTLFSNLSLDQLHHKYYKVSYTLKYLSFTGFRPNLNSCIECGIKDYDNMFFTNSGGLICNSCVEENMEYVRLSKAEIEMLNVLLYAKFSEINFINTQSSVIIDKLDDLIYQYVLYCGELFELKTQNLYNRLNKV